MTAQQNTCIACGSPLTIENGRRARCSNPNCPEGGMFYRCGFCGLFSFAVSPGKLYCINPNCRMYKKQRKECKDCNLVSRIDYKGHDVCMNRNCPSNKEIVKKCFFCGNISFLEAEGLNFCTKGNCTHLLIPVTYCPVCKQRSLNLTKRVCENKACPVFNIPLKKCPSCGKTAMINDPKHPEFQVCKSCGYSERSPVIPDNINATIAIPGMSLQALMDAGGANGGAEQKAPTPPEPFMPAAQQQPETPDSPPTLDIPEPAPPQQPTEMADNPSAAFLGGGEQVQKTSEPQEPLQQTVVEPTPGSDSTAPAPTPSQPAQPVSPPPQPSPTPPAQSSRASGGWQAGDQGATSSAQPPQPSARSTPAETENSWNNNDKPAPAANGGWEEQAEPVKNNVSGTGAAAGEDDGWGGGEEESGWSSGDGSENDAWQEQPVAMESQSAFTGEPGEEGTGKERDVSSIAESFEFIKDYILKDGDKTYPLYMIIGLAGSGKTTYLTMLGDILAEREQKYYFPYPDIKVNFVQVKNLIETRAPNLPEKKKENITRRVRDLVNDYAQEFYNNYLGQMHWAGATIPEGEEEQSDRVHSMFLVTEIVQYGRTIGKIVTLETSGEDYKELIHGIKSYDAHKKTGSPMQRVLFDMLNVSEGFVILFSPEDTALNAQQFQNLFLMLETELRPRAFHVVYEEARKNLLRSTTGRKGLAALADDMLKKKELERNLLAAWEKKKQELGTRLKNTISRLDRGEKPTPADRDFIDFIDGMLQKVDTEAYAHAIIKLRKKRQKQAEADRKPNEIFVALCKKALQDENLMNIVLEMVPKNEIVSATDGVKISRSQKDGVIINLKNRLGLSDDFHIDLNDSLKYNERPRSMLKLKNLAMVVTKADMFHICYPPKDYRKKLGKCYNHLLSIENYLKLLGGGVHYYNASATGYSLRRDTWNYPGKSNTLTPINILEPIFDMMGIKKEIT